MTTRRAAVMAQPLLRLRDFRAPSHDHDIFQEFYNRQAELFYFGRGALWRAVTGMKLSKEDTVLAPAYHCGVEIEAIRLAGAQVRYYDLAPDLTVTLPELRRTMDDRTRGLLLIHYFGFPQPVEAIRGICRAAHVTLIEDCCHALFSSCNGQPLGTFGDMAVFSQRKSLPLPDGGALFFNSAPLPPSHPEQPRESVAVKKALGMLFRTQLHASSDGSLPFPFEHLARLVNRSVARASGRRYDTGMLIDADRCNLGMSRLSRAIMNRTDSAHLVRQRRVNYLHLLDMLNEVPGIGIIHHELPEGVCPLYLPVMVHGSRREALRERLLREGIHTFVFGEKPHPDLSGQPAAQAERFTHDLLCLPVHQGLTVDDMTFIGETVRTISGDMSNAAAD